jgi:hypothetical protein
MTLEDINAPPCNAGFVCVYIYSVCCHDVQGRVRKSEKKWYRPSLGLKLIVS